MTYSFFGYALRGSVEVDVGDRTVFMLNVNMLHSPNIQIASELFYVLVSFLPVPLMSVFEQ